MTVKMKKIQDDEIDLIKLFQTIWDGKWIISAFTLIAMLIGTGYIYIKDPAYVSKLTYSVDNKPPFYKEIKVYYDYKKKFHSKKNFNDWKKIVGKSLLTFDNISDKDFINGFSIKKSEGQQLATIKDGKDGKDSPYIILKTNQLSILDEVLKYADFVNEVLSKDYVDKAKDELELINLRFAKLSSVDIGYINHILSINRFLITAKKVTKILFIESPTMPKKKSPKSKLTLFASLIFGGMIGVIFVLISNSIRIRKE